MIDGRALLQLGDDIALYFAKAFGDQQVDMFANGRRIAEQSFSASVPGLDDPGFVDDRIVG